MGYGNNINAHNSPYAVSALLAAIITVIFPVPDKLAYFVASGVIVAICLGLFFASKRRAVINGAVFGFVLVAAHFFIYHQYGKFDVVTAILLPLVTYGACSTATGAAIALMANKLRPKKR